LSQKAQKPGYQKIGTVTNLRFQPARNDSCLYRLPSGRRTHYLTQKVTNMKNKVISSRILAIALIVTLSLAAAVPALANDEKKTIPVELKFVGNISNQPVFQLSFNGQNDEEYIVIVRDEFNNLLYRDVLKGDKGSRKYMLNKEELGDTGVSFEIIGGKNQQSVIYEINQRTRMVNDLVINRKN